MPPRWPSGATRAATSTRSIGTPARWLPSASRSTGASGARCGRCPEASRSGWSSSRCCAVATRSCCSTSPTTIWTHGGGFAGYAQARHDRNERLDELRRRWDEEHEKLKELVRTLRHKASYNDGMASRYQAAVTRLTNFQEAGPPEESPQCPNMRLRLPGGPT